MGILFIETCAQFSTDRSVCHHGIDSGNDVMCHVTASYKTTAYIDYEHKKCTVSFYIEPYIKCMLNAMTTANNVH